jgi:hypothetical protein
MKYKHVPSNSGGKSGTCSPLMKWIIIIINININIICFFFFVNS